MDACNKRTFCIVYILVFWLLAAEISHLLQVMYLHVIM